MILKDALAVRKCVDFYGMPPRMFQVAWQCLEMAYGTLGRPATPHILQVLSARLLELAEWATTLGLRHRLWTFAESAGTHTLAAVTPLLHRGGYGGRGNGDEWRREEGDRGRRGGKREGREDAKEGRNA